MPHIDDVDPTRREELHLSEVVLAPDGLPTVVPQVRERFAALVTERLICLECRYYMDMLVPSGDRGPEDEDPRLLQRWCLRHGDLDLTDAEVFACSGFSPLPWRRQGRRMLKRSRQLIRFARERVKQRTIDNALARGEDSGLDYGDFVVKED